ncbi:MAG: DUF4387 family protein [Gammaproteobacteria bacterium]|nr:DUF4387 family protein [Gammaproteobacteria bacterium]
MATLHQLGIRVRTKNAGPFWVTADLFCGNPNLFALVSAGLDTARVGRMLGVSPTDIKRFDIAELNVVKLSLPRPITQGDRRDRDMHGAQWAHVLAQYALAIK